MKKKESAVTDSLNTPISFHHTEKEKHAAELLIANKELAFQNREKEKRATELGIANKELAFQNEEKEKRAAELLVANKELAFQNEEKEKRAAELLIANEELAFQNEEKEKRAAELLIANKELAFQNEEKEKRAAELLVANTELAFQNEEKEKRATELGIANKELAFQNEEKEKRATELVEANRELLFQNLEKEKRAEELVTANIELQKAEENIRKLNQEDIRKLNEALEKKVADRTEELKSVNSELESFSYSVSHDLRAPLRIVNGYATILHEEYNNLFDDEGKRLLSIITDSAKKMGFLIDDLLAFSRLGRKEIYKSTLDLNKVVSGAVEDLNRLAPHHAKITIGELGSVLADKSLLTQVWMNLLSNAIKYSFHKANAAIEISCEETAGTVVYKIADNGVGFDMRYAHKLFGVFQRLHDAEEFEGVGVGLALVHRIIKKHGGKIWATAVVNEGAVFYFSLPK
jgi:signal transduction histidine kinase